jgi:glycosyltransferase involved in cell wall biosynthesis
LVAALVSAGSVVDTGRSAIDAEPRSVLVIERGQIPSTDYFVRPQVARLGVPIRRVDCTRPAVDARVLTPDALVVFVRYIEPGWARAVERARDRLAGVVLFMDDDLLEWGALSGLRMRYRYKIWHLTLRRKKWLQRMNAELWVSTQYLATKYAALNPIVVSASPTQELLAARPGIRVFYHGTASHAAEIRWLVPIIRKVQEQCDDSFFEIFGRADVNRLYRDIPRTAVLHPMSWPNYLAYTSLGGGHVGLAPLLPGRFGAGRSSTKFFDFVRCGAVGIYSDVAPYSGFVRDGVDGLLVRNDPHTWVEAIQRLVRDDELRAKMAQAASQRAGAG